MIRKLKVHLLCLMLFSCSSQTKMNSYRVKDDSVHNDIQASSDQYNGLVLFKGTGNEPFWSIEITDTDFRFKSMVEGLESFTAPYSKPDKTKTNELKFETVTKSGSFQMTLQPLKCIDSMSGEERDYHVSISIKNDNNIHQYEGCGSFNTDYRLHDIWVLYELRGNKVKPTDFMKELPNLEIKAAENTFMGYAGCNQMRGMIKSQFNEIQFKDIVSTKMACGNSNLEPELLAALQSITHFKLENNKLMFLLSGEPQVIFKKVD